MGSLLLFLWRCSGCSGHWRMTRAEELRRNGTQCPLCGSRSTERVRTGKHAGAEALTGRLYDASKGAKTLPLLKGEAPSPINRHFGLRGSERELVHQARVAAKSRRRVAKLSSPTIYRLAVLRSEHKRRALAKAKAERQRHADDLTVIGFIPPPKEAR